MDCKFLSLGRFLPLKFWNSCIFNILIHIGFKITLINKKLVTSVLERVLERYKDVVSCIMGLANLTVQKCCV